MQLARAPVATKAYLQQIGAVTSEIGQIMAALNAVLIGFNIDSCLPDGEKLIAAFLDSVRCSGDLGPRLHKAARTRLP